MLARTNVNHRCPGCGKDKWKSIGPGWVQREALCQTCGITYTLTRDMHNSGLSGRILKSRKQNQLSDP